MLQNQEKLPELTSLEPCREECSFCFLNFTDVLLKNPLFTGLEKRQVGGIIRNVLHQVRELREGEVFVRSGDRVHHLVIILEGAVVGEMIDPEGNVLRVEKIKAPLAIATAFLFGKNDRYPVTVSVTETTKLLLIARDDVLKLFSRNSMVMINFLDMISDRAQFLGQRIRMLTLPGLKVKMAFYLLGLLDSTGRYDFRLPHTQKELSELFNTTRPSVGRIFRDLHREGYIHAEGKQIRILDRSGLVSLLGGTR